MMVIMILLSAASGTLKICFCVQLQTLLADYLDVHNTASRLQHIQPVALDDENVDIASYFTRKRPAKPKRVRTRLLSCGS